VSPAARELYGDVIRERWRRPRFRGELPPPATTAEDVNPLCGDRVRLSVRLHDGAVEAVRFTGDSCAICSASADVLAELAEGRPTVEAAGLGVDDVLAVLQSDIRPTRMRCVTLPVTVFATALENAERNHQPPGTGHPRTEPGARAPLQ
jgi:nitrogen fixation protein NifU and related proteins